MEYKRITLDSHALIWYIHEPSKDRLSKTALNVIRGAEKNGVIYIPTIVLLEVLILLEKGRYPISFDVLLKEIEENEVYKIASLDSEIVKMVKSLDQFELHDRIIAATAIVKKSVLVTKDRNISRSNVETIW